MTFEREETATFKFRVNEHSTDTITLQGISSEVENANQICTGVSSLMAIGGNTPYYIDGVRTVKDIVNDY